MRTRPGRAWLAGAAALVLAGALPGAAATMTAAAATTRGADVADPTRPVLVHQPPWVTPGDTAVLELQVPETAGELEVEVIAHRAVTSRSAFTRILDGAGLGGVEGRLALPVEELPINPEGHRLLAIGIEGEETPPDAARIVPGRTGVYPVDVVFRRPGASPSARFVTPLVVVAPGLVPLTVAWVWRFDATPAHRPDGRLRNDAARALLPGGRLAQLAAMSAGAAGPLPLTLAPTPETLEAWQGMAGGDAGGGNRPENRDQADLSLAQLRNGAVQPHHQLVAAPYVPAGLPKLMAAGLAGEMDRQFVRGGEAITETLGISPAPATLLAGSLDTDSLSWLRQRGVQRLVLPPAALRPVDQRLTPGRPFLVGTRARPVQAAASDPGLADLLTGDDPPAVQAARFLAALSLVAFEAPRERRGVVVVMPPDWNPTGALLATVLAGLAAHPALVATTVDGFFAEVPPEEVNGRARLRTLAEPNQGGRGLDAEALAAVRSRVEALNTVLGPDQSRARAAERALLLAQMDPPPDRGGGGPPTTTPGPRAYLDAAREYVTSVSEGVRGPDGQRVTLTARRAHIPISLLNANPEPLRVRVRLESDQLRFPGGAERVLVLPPQNTTERFAVETRASGAFPLVITVTSPDGTLMVNRSELTIRSTVVSGVGALLTAGAGMFLLVWWVNDLRRSRRSVGSRHRHRPGQPVAVAE